MSDEVLSLDGALVPAGKARVPVDDPGLLYGDGLFETVRLVGGRPVDLEAHLARMAASAAFFGIPVVTADLAAAVREVARLNGHLDGACRITVTRRPTVIVRTRADTGYTVEEAARGVDVVVSPIRQNAESPLPRHKTLAYLERLWARREAARVGAREAIMLNTRGRLAEGTASNVFLVKEGMVRTPEPSANILPGITRAIIVHLCKENRVGATPCAEADLGPEDLATAEEVFLTNSLAGVLPVARIDGRSLPGGSPGPVTTAIRDAYAVMIQ